MRIVIAILSAVTLIASSAFASDFRSPRTTGLGGAGHAGPILNDSIYLNPSYASFTPTYSLGANYVMFKGPSNAEGVSPYGGNNLNLSVQDGRSEVFQAGLGYTRFGDLHWLNFGASKALLKRWGIGLGGKMVFGRGDAKVNIEDAIFSTTVIAASWLQAVAVVDNLFESEGLRERGLYREFILGTKINIRGIMMVYFDPHWIPSLPEGMRYGHETGIELTFMQDLFLRFGSFRNAYVPHSAVYGSGFGTGIGWVAPRASFDYGIARVLAPVPSTAHVLGMTIYY